MSVQGKIPLSICHVMKLLKCRCLSSGSRSIPVSIFGVSAKQSISRLSGIYVSDFLQTASCYFNYMINNMIWLYDIINYIYNWSKCIANFTNFCFTWCIFWFHEYLRQANWSFQVNHIPFNYFVYLYIFRNTVAIFLNNRTETDVGSYFYWYATD